MVSFRPARLFRLAPTMLMLAGVVALAGPAAGQEDRLDRSKMIRGLTERGMDELLGRYLEQVGDQMDPIALANLELERALMAFRDSEKFWDDRVAALDRALDIKQRLIRDHPDALQVPMWEVELAELLLFEKISVVGNQAELFFEFGQPDTKQRAVFESAAVQAYIAANNAFQGFDQLQGKLLREGAGGPTIKALEDTGLLFDKEQYEQVNAPVFLAFAAYYVTLLPDSHRYFAGIAAGRRDPAVPQQAATVALERTRLLTDALSSIEPFADDQADPHGIRKRARSLRGRIQVAMGNVEDGIEDDLAPLAADQTIREQPLHLSASLGVAFGLAKQRDFGAAQDQLAELEAHPLVEGYPLYRLLLADAAHRIAMIDISSRPADQQVAMMPAAYQPYFDMLEAIPADQRGAIQGYLFQRWEESVPADAPIETFPTMVRLAVAELALARGSEAETGARLEMPGKLEEADAQFTRAIEAGQTLMDPQVPETFRARGMYAMAMAIAQQQGLAELKGGAGQDLGALLKVINLTRQIAEEMPDQPVARDAAQAAAIYARKLHEAQTRSGQTIAGADSAYESVASLLFEKYPDLPITKEQYVYYAMHMLAEKGQIGEAVAMYGRTPFTSPDYFLAQRQRLLGLETLWQQMENPIDRQVSGKALGESAEAVAEECRRVMAAGVAEHGRDRVAEAELTEGLTRIILAQLDAGNGRVEEAMARLEGFEEDFATNGAFIPMALERRIAILIAADRLEEASDAARKMMTQFPDDAAAVVSELLDKVEQRIDELTRQIAVVVVDDRKKALIRERTKQAEVAVKLADVLLAWARTEAPKQGWTDEQMLPYRLPGIKALRLSGDLQEALKRITPLAAKYGDYGQVLEEQAEILFATGEPANLRAARPIYIRLIRATQDEAGPTFWRSWVRVLSIASQLNEGAEKIPGRVRQLRTQVDPELGGPVFRGELVKLETMHAGR